PPGDEARMPHCWAQKALRSPCAGRDHSFESIDCPMSPPGPNLTLDHGAIGNGRVIALVSPTSAIEWLCLPRFDSPSVFARLLDRERGGTFRILAGEHELRGSLRYMQNTNVLATRFEADGCKWEVIDYAPRIPEGLGVRVPLEI